MTQAATLSFGELLRHYRRAAGLTQEELAARAGISARAVSDLERDGARTPRRDTLALLAGALALTPEQLARWQAAARPAAAHAAPHNLPVQLTSFVGRAPELVEGRDLLADHRLVTLTGVGGVGKTRLALAVARLTLPAFPDGVWAVELARLEDPAFVQRALALALAIREGPGESLPDALVRGLREGQRLLVLDNCEHLLDACARLAETLLRACPQLRILATSRQPLGVPGEVTWRLASLALPDPTDEAEPTALGQAEAVQLFVERARAARPDFALTARNAATVGAICRRLDGIPLAIELAAARVRALPLEGLAARLDDRFRILTGGSRTAIPRHQTLRATLDWSYRLLDKDERTLLQRLGVFAGGWTIEAAEAVCADEQLVEGRIIELLTGLVEKSLVGLDENAPESRYRMLETVRQYALERLREAGAVGTIRQRQAAWAVMLIERLRPQLLADAEAATLAPFVAEDGNLRQALAWCREHDAAVGLRLCATLWRYWNTTRLWTEGQAWTADFVARDGGSDADRAQALLGRSVMAKNQGALTISAAAARQSRDLFRALGDHGGESAALTNLQIVLINRLEIAGARQAAEEALALAQTLGDDLHVGAAWTNITPILGFLGKFAEADEALTTSIALLRRAGASESWLIAPHTFRAWVGLWRDDLPATRAALHAAESLLRAHPHYLDDDHVPIFRGDLLLREGDPATAATLLTVAAAALRRTHSITIFNALALLGLARWRQGDRPAALAAWREGFALRRAIESDYYTLVLLATLGVAATETLAPAAAVQLLAAVERMCQIVGLALPTVGRPEHAAAVAAARAALGDAVFARAWAAGEALDLSGALALADGLLASLEEAPA